MSRPFLKCPHRVDAAQRDQNRCHTRLFLARSPTVFAACPTSRETVFPGLKALSGRLSQPARSGLGPSKTAKTQHHVESDPIAGRLLERIQSDLLEPETALKPDSDLFAAGLDSMAIMQLTLMVEEEFGVRIPESLISRATFGTVRDLAGVVARLKELQAG